MADILKTMPVNGVQFDGRQAIVRRMKQNDYVVLRLEPHNVYDSNAVGVWFMNEQIGYLPKAFVAKYAGCIQDETIGTVSRIRGGSEDYPTLGVEIQFLVRDTEVQHE